MKHDVVIAGIGQTEVGEHWDISLRELAFFAVEKARADAAGLRPQALYVGNMLGAALSHQSHLGTLVADFSGLQGIEASTVEAAGASGGLALRFGYLAVASGMVDTALVVGAEKLTDQTDANVEAAMGSLTDADYEAEQGMTATSQAALLMRRYMHEYGVSRDAFAGFPVTSHANGVANPNAMFRQAIKAETYAKVGPVSDPMNMFDIAPNADGAAAILLTRRELLPEKFPHPLIAITASSVATDTLALHDRPNPLLFSAARLSVERALKQADLSIEDLDFFELFDAFSIYSALSLEAAGFAGQGEGWKLAENGAISLQGKLPITTFGGLKARGNPGGATGVYQVVEAALQLRGQAGDNQVAEAKTALVQSMGGPAATVATHILQLIEKD
ncbi:MAG: thiolase domain-containing protein [Anaerolineales bacterium]|nr:thiolase domain-containing protein [Anaerolineales bacterium]